MTALRWAVRGIRINMSFAVAMARRELLGQYHGMMIGLAWQVLRPMANTVVWVVLVTYVFKARLGADGGELAYAVYVLAGMVPWVMLQRGLEEATVLVGSRVEILKNGVYPVETLPVTALLVGLAAPLVNVAACLALGAKEGMLAWSALMLPLGGILIATIVVGMSWFIMIAGVALRDSRELVGVFMNFGVFASPVFLTPEMAGPTYWTVVLLNPFSHPVLVFRDLLLGTFNPVSWAVTGGLAVASMVVGASVLYHMRQRIIEYM